MSDVIEYTDFPAYLDLPCQLPSGVKLAFAAIDAQSMPSLRFLENSPCRAASSLLTMKGCRT